MLDVLDADALGQRVRDRTVTEMVALAPTAIDPEELPFPAPRGAKADDPRPTHAIL